METFVEAENAAYFCQRAEQCRRLADMIINKSDPIVARLLTLAVEFETRAATLPLTGREQEREAAD